MGISASPNGSDQALAVAHGKLLADQSLQFEFAGPRPPAPPPDWLEALLRLLGKAIVAAAPALQYVFWGGVALCVVLIAWFILRDLISIRTTKKDRPMNLAGSEPWRPKRAAAQALLSDADALAAQGRFAEAAHLLLTRSIDDFAGRRPGEVRPALTSRDLARASAMPADARSAFAVIAQRVEHSLFGGHAVDADGFEACRRAYSNFALADHWK